MVERKSKMKAKSVKEIKMTDEMWEYVMNLTQGDVAFSDDDNTLYRVLRCLEGKGIMLPAYKMSHLIDMGLDQIKPVRETQTITIINRDGYTDEIRMVIETKGKGRGDLFAEYYYTVYAEPNDMTFIMKDLVATETGEVITSECIDWHYGEPNIDVFKERVRIPCNQKINMPD